MTGLKRRRAFTTNGHVARDASRLGLSNSPNSEIDKIEGGYAAR